MSKIMVYFEFLLTISYKVDKVKVSANENKLKIVDEKAAIQRHVSSISFLTCDTGSMLTCPSRHQ